MNTKLWVVRSGLVDLFGDTVEVPVINGPVAQTGQPETCVLVGTDGGDFGTGEGEAAGISARQGWASVSTQGLRDEEGEVVCSVWGWSGSTDLTATRTTVETAFSAVADAIHANRKFTAVLGNGGWIELGAFDQREVQRAKGADCRVAFAVRYSARLT
jgi:hypothetical protein